MTVTLQERAVGLSIEQFEQASGTIDFVDCDSNYTAILHCCPK